MIRELGLGSQVHVIGFVPVADLVALYRNAAALIYVSLFGPDNLPPLEAMALGCPVIAADVAAEQLGDAALLVDATRPEAIADAVKALPGARDRLIASGHKRARRFTGDDFVRGVFAQIEELVPYLRCWRPDRINV
jgi:glycosyltransferase involved in cell wall biosynthesis